MSSNVDTLLVNTHRWISAKYGKHRVKIVNGNIVAISISNNNEYHEQLDKLGAIFNGESRKDFPISVQVKRCTEYESSIGVKTKDSLIYSLYQEYEEKIINRFL